MRRSWASWTKLGRALTHLRAGLAICLRWRRSRRGRAVLVGPFWEWAMRLKTDFRSSVSSATLQYLCILGRLRIVYTSGRFRIASTLGRLLDVGILEAPRSLCTLANPLCTRQSRCCVSLWGSSKESSLWVRCCRVARCSRTPASDTLAARPSGLWNAALDSLVSFGTSRLPPGAGEIYLPTAQTPASGRPFAAGSGCA